LRQTADEAQSHVRDELRAAEEASTRSPAVPGASPPAETPTDHGP
jgi:hypothetical protein